MSRYDEAEDAVFDLIIAACRKRSRRRARTAFDAAQALALVVYPGRERPALPPPRHGVTRRARPPR